MSQLKPYAVYVHWPFCLSKCPYCDFNSHVRESIDEEAYLSAFLTEIDHYKKTYPELTIGSIFFGGGTPSLMLPQTVAAIIERISALWALEPDVEITLEANPTSVEAERFKGFRSAGVNRLSLGVQSLVDKDLKALGRQHSVEEALLALDLAKKTFPRYSFDLIYAREGQSLKQWQSELSMALDLAGDHLALYQLTIEPGTKFQGLYNKGKLVLPEESLAEDMFFLTREMTAKAGLPAYEVSNHAKVGQRSKHNMAYWLGQGYLGLGPGAHGRIREGGLNVSTQNFKKPEAWLRAVAKNDNGQEQKTKLTEQENGIERLMMGLRVNEGVHMGELAKDTINQHALEALCEQGFIQVEGQRLKLKAKGQCLLDHILASLVA